MTPTDPTTPTDRTTPTSPTTPASATADLVVTGGDIVTMDSQGTRRSAMAVLDGEIVWVGDGPVPTDWVGPATVVVDLVGQQVLPGLHDVHNHILEAFQPAAGTCIVTGYAPLRTHVDELQDCADDQIGTEWVVGWGFDFWTAALGVGDSPRVILDSAIPDRPAVILEATSHAVWANSAALAALGIDEDTVDPVGGVIVRERGVPNGLLLDAAGELAMDMAMADSPAMRPLNEEALRLGLAEAARNGITAVGDGRGYWKRGYVEAWRAIEAAGGLTLRAMVPLWAYPDANDDEQLAELTARFDSAPNARLRFGEIKVYSDGIVWLTTGALLEPYQGRTFGDPTGLTYFDEARLTRYVTELEAVGFDFHIHAIGDRGVRQALNAIEAARAVNGNLGARHRLTHLEWIAPEDIGRFAELNVSADFQLAGAWTRPQNLHDNDFLVGSARVDERAYRVRDLYEAGARVVLSSDYDVGPMSPFASMNAALTRGDQSLPSREAALRSMTIDAAYVLRHEDLVGSLEVGKRADFVVVDRDVFTTTELSTTQVLWTVVEGEEVFRRPVFEPPGL